MLVIDSVYYLAQWLADLMVEKMGSNLVSMMETMMVAHLVKMKVSL